MTFHDRLERGDAKRVQPNPARAQSLRRAAAEALRTAKTIPLAAHTRKSILRELYEALRQTCEARAYEDGIQFRTHDAITDYLRDERNDPVAANEFDRYRRLRNGINYYGDEIAEETVRAALHDIPALSKEL